MMNENLAARPFFKDAYALVAIHEFIPWEGKAATDEVQDYGNFQPLHTKKEELDADFICLPQGCEVRTTTD